MNPVLLKPRMSEKTYAISTQGVYVFDVPTDVNKQTVAREVSKIYGVTVTAVRTVTIKGKTKRLYRKRGSETGTRSDVKKAYVTLKKGDSIPIFAGATADETTETPEGKAKQTKVSEKKAKKESKEK